VKQFYSYIWLREDGTPYYVGKGFGKRAFIPHNHSVPPPIDSTRIVIFPMANEAEAFESEIALIDLFGRKDLGLGTLHNFTNGGEGTSGYKVSADARKMMGRAQKGNKNSVAYKQSDQGRAEARALVQPHGLTFCGRQHSAETRAKQSASAKLRWERCHAA
jgi:hypothetical protein